MWLSPFKMVWVSIDWNSLLNSKNQAEKEGGEGCNLKGKGRGRFAIEEL